MFCWTNRGHGLGGVRTGCVGRRGAEKPAYKVGLIGRLWEWICRLWLDRSSRAPAAGGKFDLPIAHGSHDSVKISHLTLPRRHIFRAVFRGGFQVCSPNFVQIKGVAGKSVMDLYYNSI